jgi:ABC-type antimicrobial peptide transport system permease subunit
VIGVALKGLWGRKTRSLLTAISIVLGTAMIAGTFVVRDQISGAFKEIFDNSLSKTDVLLSHKTAFTASNGATAGPLPASLIDQVRQVNGVSDAEGQIQALGALVVDGKYAGSTTGAPSLVVSTLSDTFNPYSFVSGHAPEASGQVVVNSKLASDKHLHVGQHVQFATDVGIKPVTIVGVFNVGGASTIGGATIVGTTFSDAQHWFDRVGKTSTISVKADSGVSQTELKQRLIHAMPSYVKVQTGPEAAASQSQDVSNGINSFLTPLLLAFAGATVFAGAFIIFNTFSITVAQRTREFAMLRTIGASRRQVLRSVLLEALVIGLLASLAGLAAGIGFAKLLGVLFDKAGFGLPTAPITLRFITVALPLFVGTSVALLASIGPAFRATRVPPVAALREGAELPPSALARHATLFSSLMAALGLGAIVDGVFNKGGVVHAVTGLGSTPSTLISMAAGAILCFLAVAILSSHIVGPLAELIGWPLGMFVRLGDWLGSQMQRVPGLGRFWYLVRRFAGYLFAFLFFLGIGAIVSGILALIATPLALLGLLVSLIVSLYAVIRIWRRTESEWPPEAPSTLTSVLARENTTRNPGRTAVTSSSLMIGVALVVFVAVFVNGFKNSFIDALDHSLTSDLIISSKSFSPIPKDAVSTTQSVQGVSVASGVQSTEAKINHGGTDIVNGIDPTTFGNVYTFDWLKGGSDAILNHLQGNEALIEEQFAKSHHLNIGSTFEITSVQNTHLQLRVAGEYKDPTLIPGISIPTPTFDKFTVDNDPVVILVRFQPGVDTTQGKAAVAAALKDFPVAKVQTNAEYKASTEKQVNNILTFLYVLLAMIGIISLVGIINTLALSVFERTREIGMLRAVGTTRRQLRRMVRYESVITSVIGGLLGVAVGLVFGWILTKGLSDQGISFSIPSGFVIVVLIVAAFAGVLAAILPARRAASLDVLEALQYE